MNIPAVDLFSKFIFYPSITYNKNIKTFLPILSVALAILAAIGVLYYTIRMIKNSFRSIPSNQLPYTQKKISSVGLSITKTRADSDIVSKEQDQTPSMLISSKNSSVILEKSISKEIEKDKESLQTTHQKKDNPSLQSWGYTEDQFFNEIKKGFKGKENKLFEILSLIPKALHLIDEDGNTILHLLAANNEYQILKKIIEKYPNAPVHIKNLIGEDYLTYGIRNRLTKVSTLFYFTERYDEGEYTARIIDLLIGLKPDEINRPVLTTLRSGLVMSKITLFHDLILKMDDFSDSHHKGYKLELCLHYLPLLLVLGCNPNENSSREPVSGIDLINILVNRFSDNRKNIFLKVREVALSFSIGYEARKHLYSKHGFIFEVADLVREYCLI